MALQFAPKPLPDDVTKTVPHALRGFSSFNAAPEDLQEMLRESAEGRGHAWRVFTLGVADVLEGGKGLDGAHPGGWRIAARSGEDVIAGDIYTGNTARVQSNIVEAGPPRLACIRRGEEVLKMFNTIQLLPELSRSIDIPEQSFYLHLLLLPGLVTDSLWLQPQGPTEKVSYVVPFNTLMKKFDEERVSTSTRFIQIVRPIAEHWRRYREQQTYRPFERDH